MTQSDTSVGKPALTFSDDGKPIITPPNVEKEMFKLSKTDTREETTAKITKSPKKPPIRTPKIPSKSPVDLQGEESKPKAETPPIEEPKTDVETPPTSEEPKVETPSNTAETEVDVETPSAKEPEVDVKTPTAEESKAETPSVNGESKAETPPTAEEPEANKSAETPHSETSNKVEDVKPFNAQSPSSTLMSLSEFAEIVGSTVSDIQKTLINVTNKYCTFIHTTIAVRNAKYYIASVACVIGGVRVLLRNPAGTNHVCLLYNGDSFKEEHCVYNGQYFTFKDFVVAYAEPYSRILNI